MFNNNTEKKQPDFEKLAKSADRAANASLVLRRNSSAHHSFKSLAAALRYAQKGGMPKELLPYLERVKADLAAATRMDEADNRNKDRQTFQKNDPDDVEQPRRDDVMLSMQSPEILPDDSIPQNYAGNLAHYPLQHAKQEAPPQPQVMPVEQPEHDDETSPVDSESFRQAIDRAVDAAEGKESPQDVLERVQGLDTEARDTPEDQEEAPLPSPTQIQSLPSSAAIPEESDEQSAEQQQESRRHTYLPRKAAGHVAKGRMKKSIKAAQASGNLGKLTKRQMSTKLAKAGAVEGAVEGLLQGDVKKAAWLAACYYFIDIMFGIMVATSESIIGSVLALVYLDFHYFMSKMMGSKFFCEMGFMQKVSLVIANFIVAIIVIFAFIILNLAWCLAGSSTFNTIWQLIRGNFVNYCFS